MSPAALAARRDICRRRFCRFPGSWSRVIPIVLLDTAIAAASWGRPTT
ncbi:hypothetical protein [Micromonospora sp. NBC_01796]|nr:hypothetical protein [Micromonospora sp. NBC_01796]WSA85126.1 hypothetical protein OIE47_33000 [Micromonospora sp. NBC_01796]